MELGEKAVMMDGSFLSLRRVRGDPNGGSLKGGGNDRRRLRPMSDGRILEEYFGPLSPLKCGTFCPWMATIHHDRSGPNVKSPRGSQTSSSTGVVDVICRLRVGPLLYQNVIDSSGNRR